MPSQATVGALFPRSKSASATADWTAPGLARDREQPGRHRGIAARAFERTFRLADHVRVAGASIENGLLHVDLVREIPEAMKPRRVPIGAGAGPKVIDADAA